MRGNRNDRRGRPSGRPTRGGDVKTRSRTLMTGGLVSLTLAAALVASSAIFHAQTRQTASPSKLRFDVSFVPQIHDGPITGRAFVMVTRTIDKVPEPRLQIG